MNTKLKELDKNDMSEIADIWAKERDEWKEKAEFFKSAYFSMENKMREIVGITEGETDLKKATTMIYEIAADALAD